MHSELAHHGAVKSCTTLQFLVRWSCYEACNDTWEPYALLQHALSLHTYLRAIGHPVATGPTVMYCREICKASSCEPLYSVRDTRCGGGCDVHDVITAVVLKGRSDVIAGGAMRSPGSTSRWFIVNEDIDASRGDGMCAKIMSTAVKTCIGGDGWISRVRYEMIKAELHLRQKHVPQRERESRISCANRAERSIQTLKNHAISTLGTTDPTFPLALCDMLLRQTELCLNHLIPYAANPAVSAYAGLHGGAHDFRAHPIAPAGVKVLIHDKPSACASWAPYGTAGYYIGPALQHYRCYHVVYVTSTATTRVTDTVLWFAHGVSMPNPSPHDLVLAAIADLSSALKRFRII